MKSKSNPDAASRNSAASAQSASPSVPISVYRELAAELQATRAMVDSLNAKNQELTLQNQKFRQEIKRVVQSVSSLQPLIESPKRSEPSATLAQSSEQPPSPAPSDPVPPSSEEAASASAIAAKLRPIEPNPFAELFTEEKGLPPSSSQIKKPRDLGGLWLTLMILAIVITAFGAGFLVVRPLLPTGGKTVS
ncbi:MAG: hypothetical protein HC769_34240 [Cyanobacteria bacterium CRU_2_1]|nr:hypothetical protein [Cyanobacteria bacterium RU_5_0]NJR63397.1 hypothetical protein [Cyanobacteria bacterium CRU_2_1]